MHVQKILNDSIIEPSTSPYQSRLLLVPNTQLMTCCRLPKGEQFQRMFTIDMRGLSETAFLRIEYIIIYRCSIRHQNDNLIKVFLDCANAI